MKVIYTSRDVACRWPGCPCDGLNPPGSPQHYTENVWAMIAREDEHTKIVTICAAGHVTVEVDGVLPLMYAFPPRRSPHGQ